MSNQYHFKSLTLNEGEMREYASKQAMTNLWTYFRRVVKGNPEEYRTSFYGKSTPLQKILDGWTPTLKTISKEWPSLWAFEKDLQKKVGPMSIMKPLDERMDDIDSYYESILLDSEDIPDYAIDAVLKEYQRVSGLRIRSAQLTLEHMRLSTNSGLPYFTRRRDVRDEMRALFVTPDFQEFNGKRWKQGAVLGWRGQEGGMKSEDVKQRVIWMFPFADNVAELSCYQPLIEACQSFNLVPAWVSMDAVDARITRMFDTKGRDDYVICTDFEKFDQHFNHNMQAAALAILSSLLMDDSVSHGWLTNVFPIKYSIPLMYNYGKLAVGHHGMASGSGGTNADETLVHRALQHEAAIRRHKILNPNSQCLGDDGVLTYPGIRVEDVIDTYSKHGQIMNQSKQYVSKLDCTYLRRWHHAAYRHHGICVGVYSTYRALGRLAEQERFYDPSVWGPHMVALRQLSIIENTKWHPLFTKFVDYCMKGDKFRLGIDIPGFLDNIQHYAQEATDYMPDFLGYTNTLGKADAAHGIQNWRVVQYLKSKL